LKMAVLYTGGGGGGFLGTFGKLLGAGSMFVPGLQPWAAAIGAASSFANGDPAGAISNGMGLIKGKAPDMAAPMAPIATPAEQEALSRPGIGSSLTNVLQNAPSRQGGLIMNPSFQETAPQSPSFANVFAKYSGGAQGLPSVIPGRNQWMDVMQTDPRRQAMMQNMLFNTRRY
jgi:hypothetical protein